jgi:transcriptional regulator with XRE-family HTH domain
MNVAPTDIPVSPVRDLRKILGLTLAEMGERVGISKSQMHEVERTGRASLPVALEIERLSVEAMAEGIDGVEVIDAADLSEDVRKARHAQRGSASEVQNHVG